MIGVGVNGSVVYEGKEEVITGVCKGEILKSLDSIDFKTCRE